MVATRTFRAISRAPHVENFDRGFRVASSSSLAFSSSCGCCCFLRAASRLSRQPSTLLPSAAATTFSISVLTSIGVSTLAFSRLPSIRTSCFRWSNDRRWIIHGTARITRSMWRNHTSITFSSRPANRRSTPASLALCVVSRLVTRSSFPTSCSI